MKDSERYGIIVIYEDKPLSITSLVNMASKKAQELHNIQGRVNILTYHYFKEHGMYAVVFERVSQKEQESFFGLDELKVFT